MPELPEVETVRRGLAPVLEGARIDAVRLNRADLRFPFPERLDERIRLSTIVSVGRRAKYLLFRLSNGLTLLSHLGMTGSYAFPDRPQEVSSRYYPAPQGRAHEHFEMDLTLPAGAPARLVYADARRFGFMDLFENEAECPYLRGLGPEPLSNGFNAHELAQRIGCKKAPLKAVLLDQRVVAGLGNIYVSEALHRARLLPTRPAQSLATRSGRPSKRLERLAAGIKSVLLDAIEAGGSTLQDFRGAGGEAGTFQQRFSVYDREGEPCPRCSGTIRRIVQSGRSSFFCPRCQR